MQFNITIDQTTDASVSSDPVTVGWLLSSNEGGIIFEPPRRVRTTSNNRNAKSAGHCPAIIQFESRFFEIQCPYDVTLEFVRTEQGEACVRDQLGDQSGIRQLSEVIVLTDEAEWRDPNRPILQLLLPYIFIADDPVYLSQLTPFAHYRPVALPGLMLGGRFPINIWPRPLMWAFEWHDVSQPLQLHRGEPLFYVQFETVPQNRSVQLVEAKRTRELENFIELISGAVNYVNQTFSLFKSAEERRPTKLVEPV